MQTWPQPVKLTMTGPMFRYDRPQAGRYRQFWQFDVEAIGDPGPAIDAEIIELGRALLRAGRPGRDPGPAQLDRRPAVPPGVHRGIDRVLRAARGAAAGPRTRAPAQEPAAPARLEGPRAGRAERRRAADHRPAVRPVCRALRERPRAPRRPRRRLPDRTRAGPRPRLLHPDRVRVLRCPAARASSRRWVAADATTGWSSCSAAGRRPGSASGWASTGSCSPSRPPVAGRPSRPPIRRRSRSSSGRTRPRRRSGSGLRPTARGGHRGPGRPGPAQARQASRGGGPRPRPFRGDHRRRAGRRECPAARTSMPDRSSWWPSRTWPASWSVAIAPTATAAARTRPARSTGPPGPLAPQPDRRAGTTTIRRP